MLKYLRGGFLGGPPIFVACQSISVVVIRAMGSGGCNYCERGGTGDRLTQCGLLTRESKHADV
jgi:hypothetical protein